MSNRKEKGYSHKKADARKDLKREQAEDRQVKYSSLTRAERIAVISNRPGESKRELARIKLMK